MVISFDVVLVVVLALLAANLPFLTNRVFGIVRLSGVKSLGFRVVELLAYYVLAGVVGLLLERKVGQISSQTWEFYVITLFLFLTFSFPGFVYRYLVMRRP